MLAPQRRWSVIGLLIAIACAAFIALDSMSARNWQLLLVMALIPPAMLLWLWNEDGPDPWVFPFKQ